MKTFLTLLVDLLWLGAAGVALYFFPWTVLAVELVAGAATLALYLVERSWT